MRSNSYARYTNPGKFTKPKDWAEEAIRDGNRIREMLEGKKVFELPFGVFVQSEAPLGTTFRPSTHIQKPKHDRMAFE